MKFCQKEKNMSKTEQARYYHEKWLKYSDKTALDRALNLYSEATCENPEDYDSYCKMTMLLYEAGKMSLEFALRRCVSAFENSPGTLNAGMYSAYFLYLANKSEEAENVLKTALKSHFLSARLRANMALLTFERAFTENKPPKLVQSGYYFLSGLICGLFDKNLYSLIKTYVSDNAGAFFLNFCASVSNTLNSRKTTKYLLLKAASLTSEKSEFLEKAGDFEIKQKNPRKALAAYKSALKKSPESRDLLLKTASVLQAFFPEKIDETIDVYTRVLSTDGDNAPVYYEIGDLYVKKCDYVNAANAFKLACDKDPVNPCFRNAAAFALFACGQVDDAEEQYLFALTLCNDDSLSANIYKALGVLYKDVKGDLKKARTMFEKALVFAPTDVTIYEDLGDLFVAISDFDRASRCYKAALTFGMRGAGFFNKYAASLRLTGNIDEAVTVYDKAIKSPGEISNILYNNLGIIYLEDKNDPEKAVKYFELAIKDNLLSALPCYSAARAYAQLNMDVKAAKLYNKALKLNKFTGELDEEIIKNELKSLFDVA